MKNKGFGVKNDSTSNDGGDSALKGFSALTFKAGCRKGSPLNGSSTSCA